MKTITVHASKTYDIEIEKDLLYTIGEEIKKVKGICKVCVISDDIVHDLYGSIVLDSLKLNGYNVYEYTFTHGEKSKNLNTYSEILNFLATSAFTRSDLIIALGGGVVGDMAGFVAASYMRGIDFVQVPTTLLAMIDSSVGGKTAVDLPSGKNLVGAFYQPIMVIVDPSTLNTLPCTEYKNGMGEGIKYALLEGGELLKLVQKGIRCSCANEISRFIELCIESKKNIVEKDEKENNIRRLLNLGHTFAHSIEKLSNYTIPHGICVAQGLRYIADISGKQNKMSSDTLKELLDLLEKYEMPIIDNYKMSELIDVMKLDKKVENGNINFVMPYDFGDCRIESIPLNKVKDLI
jgi:3-dehydroquinate synthase